MPERIARLKLERAFEVPHRPDSWAKTLRTGPDESAGGARRPKRDSARTIGSDANVEAIRAASRLA